MSMGRKRVPAPIQIDDPPLSMLTPSSAQLLSPTTRPRRPSVISLPPSSLIHRKGEDDSLPYSDGPIQIIPGIWIGSEENARDWKGLIERGIKAILNVAKEVASPFDSTSLRSVASTPDFRKLSSSSDPTYYPPHLPTGRPPLHHLKLQWSHGQQDLVNNGFQAAMAFTDAALARSEGVLVHCQCGISRSATMVIALVMRAAAQKSPLVPPEVWALKGMQGAYSFVKEKSPSIGPNMSLIYQLLDYEKQLRGDSHPSPGSESSFSKDEDEEEWSRRRRALDEPSSDTFNSAVMQEARALDKAMEDRIVARKSSTSSLASTGSGVGMGAAWRSRYGPSRKRTGSIASNNTTASIISEDLLEEDEELALLGVGGGFDSNQPEESSSASNSPDDDEVDSGSESTPFTAKPTILLGPPPAWKSSFHPVTAFRSTFDLPPRPLPPKRKRRPLSIDVLPPVPSSPITLVVEQEELPPPPPLPQPRQRTESRRLAPPPPLHLRGSVIRKASVIMDSSASMHTPCQTLFVFPPSPTLTTRTPSTMTLTSNNVTGPVPFPSLSTPRISTFRQKGGRTRSFIGVGSPPTPTVAFSKVDARGYVGIQ